MEAELQKLSSLFEKLVVELREGKTKKIGATLNQATTLYNSLEPNTQVAAKSNKYPLPKKERKIPVVENEISSQKSWASIKAYLRDKDYDMKKVSKVDILKFVSENPSIANELRGKQFVNKKVQLDLFGEVVRYTPDVPYISQTKKLIQLKNAKPILKVMSMEKPKPKETKKIEKFFKSAEKKEPVPVKEVEVKGKEKVEEDDDADLNEVLQN